MEPISLVAIGAAVFLFFMWNPKKESVDKDKGTDTDVDIDFNVDDDTDEAKPSFVCLIKKWEELKDCAEKLHLDDAVKQLNDMWPSLNKKEFF